MARLSETRSTGTALQRTDVEVFGLVNSAEPCEGCPNGWQYVKFAVYGLLSTGVAVLWAAVSGPEGWPY